MPWLLLLAGCVTGLLPDDDDARDETDVVDTEPGDTDRRDTSTPEGGFPGWTSPGADQPLIIEVCDQGSASFVEIANPTQQRLSLEGYTLQRVSGTAREVVGSESFAGLSLKPGGILVVGPIGSDSAFDDAYGQKADQTDEVVGGGGVDSYALYAGTELVDLYGALGVVGTGQPWSYRSTCSVRVKTVWKASRSWNADEWNVGVTPFPFHR